MEKDKMLEKWSVVIQKLQCDQSKHSLLAEYGEFLVEKNSNRIAESMRLFSKLKNHKNLTYEFNKDIESITQVFNLEGSREILTEEYVLNEVENRLKSDLNLKINEAIINSNGVNVKFIVGDFYSDLKLIEDVDGFRAIVKTEYKITSDTLEKQILVENQKYSNNDEKLILERVKNSLYTSVLEESKEYYWLRLYLRDELEAEKGDVIRLRYAPTSENIEMSYVCYEKKGNTDQHFSDIIEYVKEDDKKTLCLMVDVREINKRKDINTLRKLFRCGHYYEDMILRREDLVFEKKQEDSWIKLDYFDADF